MFPLHDENPTRSTPVVTLLLIAANVAVFLFQLMVGLNISVLQLGLIPAELLQQVNAAYGGRQFGLPPGVNVRNADPAWITLFSSMFMHGGWLHILGNMWYLWIFGNNVEDAMGKVKFVAFYVACGLIAAAAQILTGPESSVPMVGASGAIGGVLGAYLVLYPGSRVVCFVALGFIWTTMRLSAFIVLGFWFLIQFVRGVGALGLGDVGGVAYAAHIGGFVAGLVLGRLLGQVHPPRHREHSRRPESMDWR